MQITREMVLRFIAKNEPVSCYPLVELGQWFAVTEMEAEGLVEIIYKPSDLSDVRLTDKGGRAALATLNHA